LSTGDFTLLISRLLPPDDPTKPYMASLAGFKSILHEH
jgi:hypothetical protein